MNNPLHASDAERAALECRLACRADGCEMNGETPLKACSGCGVLVIRTVAFGVCVECVTADARNAKEGN